MLQRRTDTFTLDKHVVCNKKQVEGWQHDPRRLLLYWYASVLVKPRMVWILEVSFNPSVSVKIHVGYGLLERTVRQFWQ